jgi:DNA-binding transcriptional regulator YiaG
MITNAKPGVGAPIEALPTLPAGALVRLSCSEDPWLRRYHGQYGRVVSHKGHVVEVSLKDGTVVPFWRREAQSVPGTPAGRCFSTALDDRCLAELAPVPGFSLQSERQKVGLRQREMAAAMAVTVQRISQIEAQVSVPRQTAIRYLRAIAAALEEGAA